MMSDLHLNVLPPAQRHLWAKLQTHTDFLHQHDYYLAGGTALALQLGHRQSIDFDFFSQRPGLTAATQDWLQQSTSFTTRDTDINTLHGEVQNVKVSFISAYKYPLVDPLTTTDGLPLASLMDIGLMKLLALTHRATMRDYIDLAALLRGPLRLPALLDACPRKYGQSFNVMIPLRALVAFSDIESEMPVLLDQSLAASWQQILREAVKAIA